MFRSDKQRQSKKDKLQKDPPSGGSAGGGAFVVKRPAHLRSAVAHRNASLNSSPSVERLSSPTKGAAGGGGSLNAARLRASGSSTTGATSPEACTAGGAASGDNDVPRSHMLAIVLPSLEEFVHEREVLRNVLVDLQQHFAELDLDLECCTLFEMEDVLQNVDECVLLGELLAQRNATALVFIGDRYGEALLPLELRPEEFDALREAALEAADDVAVLLNQFYVLDRGGGETGRAAEYQLKASRDPAGAQRLRRGLQRCARRLFDGDGALALQPDAAQRHAQLFKSFIEWCAHAAEANGQSVLVTRRFHGVQNNAAGGMERWMDAAGSERAEHLNALKNALSTRLLNDPQQRLLPFLLDLRLQQKIEIDPSSWWTKCPKESAAYELELATKLTDRLKSLILAAHPNIEQPRHPPLHEPRTAAMAIVQAEHCVHSAHLASRIATRWVPRGDAIDSHLDGIVKRLFDKDENQLKSAGLFVQFHGQPGSGKTGALCRLYQLVHDRLANAAGDGKSPPVVALARFSHLTDGTIFANEMLRNAFLIVCKQYMPTTPNANAEKMIDAFLGTFHLTEVLAQAKALLEQAHALQVLLLLDDVHLLRFGRALGRMDNALRKLFPRLHIVCTSASAQPMLGFPRSVELLALSAPTADQAIGILSDPLRPLPPDQLSALRAQFHHGSDGIDLVLGAVQRDELLAGHTEVSVSIDARLARAEQRCGGADAVRLVCEFLCCAPCGLTRAELLDAVRLRNFTAGFMFEPQDVLNAAPLHVLRNLAPLLDSVLVDARRVLFFRHHSIAQAAKQRYLTSPGEIKLANETIAALFRDADSDADAAEDAASGASSAEERAAVAAAVLLFPRPISKEGGAGVDIRRVRFHWYYLLYTGNVEALKKETLCFFPYLEAAFRACGLARLLSIFEECLQQILDHDLLVIFEQVLLPGIQTLIRDPRQFVSEFLNRLRYTRAKNSVYLNILVEQAMTWTDNYADSSLLVPLTCWIPPPKMKQVLSFTLSQWKSCKLTILQPTHNHQHLLVAGNELAPDCIYMFHIASQLLVRTFASSDQKQVTSLCASKWRDTGESVQQQQQHNHHFFVSTSADGAVRVWSFTQAQCLKTLRACNARILCSVLSNDDQWMAVGSADSCARVLLLDSGQVTRTFKEHTGPVVGLQLSSDNTLLVTGSGEFVVMVWDIEKGEIVVRLQGLMAPVTCLALTSNDAFLAVACEDETLRVFSLVSAQELHELTGHESRINALVASADDCKLFAGTRGRVIVYDIHNGQLLEVLQCALERQPISSLRISDDDSFVLVACGDRIHMWALDSIERDVAAVQQQKMATTLSVDAAQPTTSQSPPATTSVSCVQIAPDEKSAGCGTADGIVAFWDLDVCQCMWTSNAQRNGAVSALCFSADSFLLLSGSEQGTVSLWETNNGQLLKQVQLHADAVVALCAFADGVRVLSCDSADNAYLWSLGSLDESAAGKRMELIASIAHMHPPLYVRLSDTVLIAQHGANPREMNVWSVSGDRLFTRSKVHHNEAILCYGVNRCGTVLCTGSQDLSLKVWQMDSGGLLIQVLVGHEDAPTCCCVSEDALAACSGALDRLLIVWDVQTGAALHALRRAAVQCFIEISMDGSVVCSNGWVEAWHYKSGRLLSAFNTHRQVEQLIMGADGDRILAKLAGTAQLPIICLHNTPANLHSASASRYERVVLPATASTALDVSPSAPAAKSVVTVEGRPLVLEFSTTTTAAATEDDDDGPMPLGDNVSTNEREEPVTSRASEVEAHANKLRDAEEEQKRRRAEQVPNFDDALAPTAQSAAASAPPSGGADAAATAAASADAAAAAVPSTSTPAAQKERRTRRSKMCSVN
uniref:NACHT domain-containing protein n=1 Tax=Globodera rostochiensis TaxID=31243 RepID=A0A914IAP9_GLORO